MLVDSYRRRALVLAPHPDDETFGCGGTIRMLTAGGVAVDVAFLTRGERGLEEGAAAAEDKQQHLAEVRSREAEAACQVLGVAKVLFLSGNDTQLREQSQLAGEIAKLLIAGGYQRVFCPWPEDAHDDHRATFVWLKRALAQSGAKLNAWLYEVWKPLPANTYVPIDGTIEAKRQAIDQYASQLEQLNYREGFLGLAAYRSLFCPPSKFAEAFLVCEAAELERFSQDRGG
jgi:LmbE family N-acetylglucosaminyl deacetylase